MACRAAAVAREGMASVEDSRVANRVRSTATMSQILECSLDVFNNLRRRR